MAMIPKTLIVALAVQNVELWKSPEGEQLMPGATGEAFIEASWEVAVDSDERLVPYSDSECADAFLAYKRAFIAAAAVA